MANTAQSFTVLCAVMLRVPVSIGTGVTDYWTKLHRCGTYTSLNWEYCSTFLETDLFDGIIVFLCCCDHCHCNCPCHCYGFCCYICVFYITLRKTGINAELVVAGLAACSQRIVVNRLFMYVSVCVCIHVCMHVWMTVESFIMSEICCWFNIFLLCYVTEKYPEIKQLFGYDPNFKWVVTGMVLVQLLMMYVMTDQPWPMIFLVAYCFGGIINHSLMLGEFSLSVILWVQVLNVFAPLQRPTLPFSHSLRLLYPFSTCGLAQLAQGLGCRVGRQGIVVLGSGILECGRVLLQCFLTFQGNTLPWSSRVEWPVTAWHPRTPGLSARIFLFSKPSRPAVGPTQPHTGVSFHMKPPS